MLKISGLLLALSLLFFPVVSQENVYSGSINSSSDYIDVQDEVIDGFYPDFGAENLELNITKVNRELEDLEIYSSYRLEVSDGNGISLELVLESDSFEKWAAKNGFEYYQYNIITDQRSVMTLNKSEERYTSQVIIPRDSAIIHIAGSEQLYEDYQNAVNPERTFCGLYWKPPKNHTTVEECSGELDEGIDLPGLETLNFPAVLAVLGLFILAIFIHLKGQSEEDRDVEEITEKIIEKMESGQLPKDRELLDKLEKANQKAYNNKYEEASKLLEEVESEIQRGFRDK